MVISCIVKANTQYEIADEQEAIIDLRDKDIAKENLNSLLGRWRFYPHQLLSPQDIRSEQHNATQVSLPHEWKDSTGSAVHACATYQTQVKIGQNAPPLAIQIPFIPTACAIFIQDSLVHQNGKVGTSKASTQINLGPIYQRLPSVKDSFLITIQIANYDFHRTGIIHDLYIGAADTIAANRNQDILFNLLISGGVVSLGIFFILAACFGIFSRNLLHLGFCFVAFAYWNSSSWSKLYNLLIPEFDWGWASRIEFLAMFVFLFSALNLSRSLYPEESFTMPVRCLQGIELLLAVTILVVPLNICFILVDFHLLVIAVSCIYFTVVVIRAAVHRKKDVFFAAWGITFCIIHFLLYLDFDLNFHIFGPSAGMLFNALMFIALIGVILLHQVDYFRTLSKKAQAGVEAKTQFLSVISHEMRTPMNGILGMTELLSTTPMSKEQKSYLQSIQASGESLIILIDDILDLTRIKEGKIKLYPKSFDFYALAKESVQVFQQRAEEKNLSLELEIADGVPQYLESSPVRLKQIVDNLINNAIKFTDEGGVRVGFSTERNNQQLILHGFVEDTGVGISKQMQNVIFRPFSQVDSSTRRKHSGVGLGLAICKQLMEAMKGEIQVQSTLGMGTTFSFSVPVEIGGTQKKVTPITVINDAAQSTLSLKKTQQFAILLAEDNPINQKLIRVGLEKLGYSVDTVTNGRQAYEAVHERLYDLILMDVQMPEMDGLEATTHILKATTTLAYRPYIVALTANAFPEDKEKALAAGVDDYLLKPLPIQKLRLLLEKIEERKAAYTATQSSKK
ncbi:MAG: ATP-binding protein [Bacteroidota bacterium]